MFSKKNVYMRHESELFLNSSLCLIFLPDFLPLCSRIEHISGANKHGGDNGGADRRWEREGARIIKRSIRICAALRLHEMHGPLQRRDVLPDLPSQFPTHQIPHLHPIVITLTHSLTLTQYFFILTHPPHPLLSNLLKSSQIHTYTYIHTDTCTYIHIHTHTYMHLHTHTYTYMHAYIHLHILTCIHAYIHDNQVMDRSCQDSSSSSSS